MTKFLISLFTVVMFSLVSAESNGNLEKYIHFDPKGVQTVGKITIDDRSSGINESTWLYVRSALEFYKKSRPIFIILELNTPGGEVFAAQKISDALKEFDTQEGIPVIAFINNWAISAGAMLAYSTRFISFVKDASMGAAEPVYHGEKGEMVTASEKVNSALRADFANRARFFGRNPLIAEAMVDKDLLLVLRNGKIVKLDYENEIEKTGPNRDIIISPKGKLLTLDAEQLMEYKVGDILLEPTKLEVITSKEKEEGRWPASKELLFQYPFFKEIPNASVVPYQMDWKMRFFTLLANPVVSSLLFLGLMLGFYVEINTPGFGVAGTVGLICLFLLILSSVALDAIHWLEVILFLTGVVLLVVDLFFIPTFGLMGIAGVVFLLVGLFGMLVPGIESVHFEYDTDTFNAAGEYVMHRLAWLLGTFIIGMIGIAFLAWYVFPKFRPFRKFVLEEDEDIVREPSQEQPEPGKKGTVSAPLRTSGKVRIEGNIYDAVTSGEYIESGAEIVVDYLDGSVIVVKRSNLEK